MEEAPLSSLEAELVLELEVEVIAVCSEAPVEVPGIHTAGSGPFVVEAHNFVVVEEHSVVDYTPIAAC